MYKTISERKVANAMGGRTSRACDSCLSKRARWFCAADDAFLCQACDVSVHSSSHLASRHERVRLETSSIKTIDTNNCAPAWHQGFTRKPRTPRNGKKGTLLGHRKKEQENMFNPLPFVPEMGCEDEYENENDQEQLLYLVPVFDPFEVQDNLLHVNGGDESTTMMKELDMMFNDDDQFNACDDLGIHDIVEGFLADGLDGNFNDEGTRIINDVVVEDKTVKIEVEDEEMRAVLDELDMEREVLMNWDDFDQYESPLIAEDDDQETVDQHKVMASAATDQFTTTESCSTRKLLLRLNHEAVINAWPNQSSPWTNGVPPHFNLDDPWPDFMKSYPGEGGADHRPYGEIGCHVRGDHGGREAIVSRYREKRRTRLFSKKIRYQVRKLNAEKRPRLKGRFVKRTSFPQPAFPYLMNK